MWMMKLTSSKVEIDLIGSAISAKEMVTSSPTVCKRGPEFRDRGSWTIEFERDTKSWNERAPMVIVRIADLGIFCQAIEITAPFLLAGGVPLRGTRAVISKSRAF
jgi:hypothetical protein